MDLAGGALAAETPADATRRYFGEANRRGASYIQTRLYRRPAARLTSKTHWDAGGVIERISPRGWPGSPAFKYICFDCNPLLTSIRENRTLYRFSDFAPHGDLQFGTYWEALGEAEIAEGLCATSYGNKDVIASLHIGFADGNVDPETARVVQLAGLLLTERLMNFAGGLLDQSPQLTPRERDCLAYMADGRRDRDIADLLVISETTVRFHIDNARRKLGARNRVEAMARLANMRQI